MNEKAAGVASSVVESLRGNPALLVIVLVMAGFMALEVWQQRTIAASMERRDNLFAQLAKDCAKRD